MRSSVHDFGDTPWSIDDSYSRVSYIQNPPIEKYPPESVVGQRNEQYEDVPPSIAWSGLNLSGLQLLSISSEVGNYTHLTALYLSKNSLTQIPVTIFTRLVNLTHLDISSNRLTYLPPEIENLRNLKTFLLAENNINKLPLELGRLWQ